MILGLHKPVTVTYDDMWPHYSRLPYPIPPPGARVFSLMPFSTN